MDEEISFRDSNDGAYTKAEVRSGPPLSYVSEKLGNGLKHTHSLIAALKGQEDSLAYSNARYAFHYQFVAFLALHNMLAYSNEKDVKDKLLSLSHDEFKAWIENIEVNGSVTG